jgi:hypothetical protein
MTIEQMLIKLLECYIGNNEQASILQSYIQEEGPLSEEAGAKVRELLKENPCQKKISQ